MPNLFYCAKTPTSDEVAYLYRFRYNYYNFSLSRRMKHEKGKLAILLAIATVITGGVIIASQKQNIFSNATQQSKQLSTKEKQLAYLREHEKDMADFVKSLSPKVKSVQFDWESMEVGQVGNGTPQGGGYMLTLRGKVNQNEQTKFMVGFSLNNAASTPKEFGIYEMQPIRIYRDGGWYYYD